MTLTMLLAKFLPNSFSESEAFPVVCLIQGDVFFVPHKAYRNAMLPLPPKFILHDHH